MAGFIYPDNDHTLTYFLFSVKLGPPKPLTNFVWVLTKISFYIKIWIIIKKLPPPPAPAYRQAGLLRKEGKRELELAPTPNLI